MSLAVVGTGTEVGKTVVSALLAERYAELRPAYWKPVASGAREGRDPELTGPAVEVLDETSAFLLGIVAGGLSALPEGSPRPGRQKPGQDDMRERAPRRSQQEGDTQIIWRSGIELLWELSSLRLVLRFRMGQ